MSLAGAFGGHSVVSKLILRFGTEEQQAALPAADGDAASCGRRWRSPSPTADPTCRRCAPSPRPVADGYVINGSKTWITNARMSGLVALLCKTDPAARPAHTGHLDPARREGPRVHRLTRPAEARLQGGRVVRAALRRLPCARRRAAGRCRGQGLRPDDDRARDRAHPGRRPGDRCRPGRVRRRRSATPRTARPSACRSGNTSRSATCWPTWRPRSPPPSSSTTTPPTASTRDGEPTWRPGWPSCSARRWPPRSRLDAIRVHGGHGYSTEFDVERYYRDAPLMIVGEGTNEVLRNVIVKQLIARNGLT